MTVIDDRDGRRAALQLADGRLRAGVQVPQRDFRAEQVNVRRDQQARGPRVLLGSDDPRPGQAVENHRGERHQAIETTHPGRVTGLTFFVVTA
ncbi:MAG: hypothetical protein ACRDOI_35035 [Trebonia sp.]